ncbi:MAG: hypothetical protein FD133_1537 [Erysipelotrichaceae bacterium]|nr:MAG: hypothetical protein FD179_1469 [Erysipelotrichaceae bacterium]TXT17147.1 MAG: hypothetical protein FD133_1537 [Erysipelotrichaceae bacterium]
MTKEMTDIASMNLEKPLYRLTLRPTLVLSIMVVLGSLLIIAGVTQGAINWGLIAFGVYVLSMVIFPVITVKNRIVCDLYDDFLIIYDKKDNTKGFKVTFDEIKTWQYKTGVALGDSLIINLEDGDSFALESFKARKVIAMLFKRIPEKEIHKDVFKFLKKK